MNFHKESKSFFDLLFFFCCFFSGRGGGGGGERGGGPGYGSYEHKSRHSFYTQYIVMNSTEPYCFMIVILTVFKIESIAA